MQDSTLDPMIKLFTTRDPSQHPDLNIFEIMGTEGDTKSIWDQNNTNEVEAARRQFEFLVKDKKYVAFQIKGEGEKGDQMREFDPKAGRVIFVPPMAGG